MKYQGIRRIHEGRFITRYDVDYVTAEGNPKTYEMISRFTLPEGFTYGMLTADEAQRNLEGILDGAWENYEKDNPDLERTSSYVVHEADKPGSVIYREKIRNIPDKLTKVDSIGYFVCIVLLLLYLVYKFIKGSEFYTTLVLTGDTKLEIVLLFLAELAILFAFACGLAFGLSWIVCKLLGLGAVSIKPIVSKNLRVVLIPFIAIAALVIAKNYGKIFRRR